jgi:hypothetical protein
MTFPPTAFSFSGEGGDSGGPTGSVFVRRAADSEPTRISDGFPMALSRDGTTALVHSHGTPVQLSVVPVSGLARQLDVGPMEDVSNGAFLNDGRLLLEIKRPRGAVGGVRRPSRWRAASCLTCRQAFTSSVPTWSPPRETESLRSRRERAARYARCPDSESPYARLSPAALRQDAVRQEQPAGWTADGRSLFVYRRFPVPVVIERGRLDHRPP